MTAAAEAQRARYHARRKAGRCVVWPLNPGGIWTAWHGGVLASSTHRAYRRAADGAFTRVHR